MLGKLWVGEWKQLSCGRLWWPWKELRGPGVCNLLPRRGERLRGGVLCVGNLFWVALLDFVCCFVMSHKNWASRVWMEIRFQPTES